MKWANGNVYVGDFVNGILEGYGTCTYSNKIVHKGWWSNGKFIKKG